MLSTLSEMLKKSTEECGDYWDLEVLFVQFNYITHDHSATGYSPFYLTQGYVPCTPRLVLTPGPAKSPFTLPQWGSTLSSRLKKAHSVTFRQGKEELQVKKGTLPAAK